MGSVIYDIVVLRYDSSLYGAPRNLAQQGTIRDNIALAILKTQSRAGGAAAKGANADFHPDLPQGYDTS